MPTTLEREVEQTTRRRGAGGCKPLLDAATKDLFRKNAFRITGLPVDAPPRVVSKHVKDLMVRVEVGQDEQAQTAALAMTPPPTLEEIHEAIKKLKDPERRLIDEFFWFWPLEAENTIPDPALEVLASGNADAALKIWAANEANLSRGVVATHNIALFWQLRALDLETSNARSEVVAPAEQLEFPSLVARQKILLVDDDPDLLDLYKEVLVGSLPGQTEVQTATSGPRGLALLEVEPFDLLICDLKLPKMDGFQVLEIVRQKYPELRTAVLTAQIDEQFSRRAYALGVDQYWHKPATDQETKMFLKGIQSLLDGNERGAGAGVSRGHSVGRHQAARAGEQTVEKCWRDSLKRWKYLTSDDLLWDKVAARVRQINEPSLTTGFVRRMRATLPLALAKVNAELALAYAKKGRTHLANMHVRLIRGGSDGPTNLEKAAELVLAPTEAALKEQIRRAKDRADRNPRDAANAARELLEQARPSFALFDVFFDKESELRNDLFDEVAALCNQLPVAYHKATGDDKACLEILKAVLPLATSAELRQQIDENISTLSGNLASKKLAPAYALLKSIQDSKESPCARLARFERDAIPALVEVGATGYSPNSGYLSVIPRDCEDLFNSAAVVLRGISLDAWNNHQDLRTALAANDLAIKHATDPDLKQRLTEDKATLQETQPVADLTPISEAPPLRTINGIGFGLYGCADQDPVTGSYLATYYFVVFFIPIFPICRYRVSCTGNTYRFFGKAPLRTLDKWHLAISIGLIIWLIIAGLSSTSSAPGYTPPAPTAFTLTPAPEQAVQGYRNAAEENNAVAQFNLGLSYDKGRGVAQDVAEAVKWYRKAAEQNLALAQFALGACYDDGRGVAEDSVEAVKWYRKAAAQNQAEAQYNLAFSYRDGRGVAKDAREAVKWFRKAAEQSLAAAQYHLGLCYDKGEGVAKDYVEAVKWYRKAAEQGYTKAQHALALCYEKGQGVSLDATEAIKWYAKALEQGSPPPAPAAPAAEMVYRVPSSVSSTLDNERAEIESERARLEAWETQIDTLSREIDSGRVYVDRTSQYAVNELNAKIARYNALLRQAKAANAAFNQKVHNFNAKLQQNGR